MNRNVIFSISNSIQTGASAPLMALLMDTEECCCEFESIDAAATRLKTRFRTALISEILKLKAESLEEVTSVETDDNVRIFFNYNASESLALFTEYLAEVCIEIAKED